VEKESSRLDSDEFLDDLFFGHISKNDVLRICRKNAEAVRNFLRVFLLLNHDNVGQLVPSFSVCEFLMVSHFTDEPIARDDVALNDFSEIVESFVAYHQFATNSSSRSFFLLDDVNVNEMLAPEFPGESYVLLTSSRRPEQKVTNFTVMEFKSCST